MAVDLSILIGSLQRETAYGATPTVLPDSMYLGYLQDAFWEAVLDGITVLNAWTESDGQITPVTAGGADITRDLLQLLVLVAGMRILRNQILNAGTSFHAKAGPVEYETENSAQVQVAILKDLQSQRNIILTRLSDLGAVPTYYIDSLAAREESIRYGDTYTMSSGYGSRDLTGWF